jgi:hypothetical protein
MDEVYLIKKNGAVIAHANLNAMEELDGIAKPHRTVSRAEWEAAGSIAYLDASGAIILGLSPEKEQERQRESRKAELIKKLNEIDREYGHRPLRDVALALNNQLTGVNTALERLAKAEAEAAPLREALAALNTSAVA